MSIEEKDLGEIKLKIGLLEKDVKLATDFSQRVSLSIEKTQEMSIHLVKMITLHEQRHSQHELAEGDLKQDIKELHSRLTTQSREIHDRIDQVEHHITSRIDALRNELIQHKKQELPDDKHNSKLTDKIDSIDKWRWMVVGALFIAGWVIGNLDILGKIFK
jgi:chromosome segregation ATPase